MQTSQDRFKGLPWFELIKSRPVHIGGAGGIGSWLALLLGRAAVKYKIFDFDSVEKHNLGGQFYTGDSVGLPKVIALRDSVKNFTDVESCEFVEGKYEGSCSTVFTCFDSIDARKAAFQSWVGNLPNYTEPPIFIDGRMYAENATVITVTPQNYLAYYSTLFKKSESESQPCTAKATSHCAALIASMMMGVYNNFLTNIATNTDAREVPFKVEFHLQTMMLLDYDVPQEDKYSVYVDKTSSTTDNP